MNADKFRELNEKNSEQEIKDLIDKLEYK